jgi:hypothetical protein
MENNGAAERAQGGNVGESSRHQGEISIILISARGMKLKALRKCFQSYDLNLDKTSQRTCTLTRRPL